MAEMIWEAALGVMNGASLGNNMLKDNQFIIKFSKFYQGFSPAAHLNSLTELGNAGHASVMQNVDILTPDYITQGPALANLTNGNQAGVVTELINFIMDKAVANDVTYGIGATKLFKITPTTVVSGGTPSWPQAITGCTDGESVIDLKGNIYGFYNKSSGGEILKMPIATEVIDPDWGSTVPTGMAALQSAPHPVATKEDIMAFGNGQYLGTYFASTDTLNVSKLDFGAGNEVADVIFHANQWQIAVNSGVSGTNRTVSQIYLYDGGAITALLSDEVAIGVQRIGFLFPLNGIVYVAYQDLSFAGGYKIGYVSGRQIKPLRYFTGSLPTFAQKTLYKNTILFIASGLVWSIGASVEQLPIQISQLADSGYATVGALAAPFGTPMIASTDGGTNFRLAKFSGYDVSCNWKSIIIPLINGRLKAIIDTVIVLTKTLGANARCDLKLEYNQNSSDSGTVKQITGTGKRRFVFEKFKGQIEDFRVFLDWSNGHTSNDCPIRQIQVLGHYVEK